MTNGVSHMNVEQHTSSIAAGHNDAANLFAYNSEFMLPGVYRTTETHNQTQATS
jgi:hypothetical protein